MSTVPEFEPIASNRSRGSCLHQRHFSVAVIDDCLDDYALLEFLLERSNISLKKLVHYPTFSDLLRDPDTTYDVILMEQCPSGGELQENKLRARFVEEGFTILERRSLDRITLGAVIAATALVGPRLN